MLEDLHGRTVVVTSGTAGMGAAAARRLAARGATVDPIRTSAPGVCATAV